MKKNLLLLMVSLFVGMISAHAYNVRINVDNAANVKVCINNGASALDLIDGMNTFDLDESANPLLISKPMALPLQMYLSMALLLTSAATANAAQA